MTPVSGDVLTDLMSVIGGSDSVELKLTVPDSHHRSAGDALDLDPVQAEIRQVVFFDTPELAMNEAGLVVRARRMPGGAGDTVIKLRPVVPDQIPGELRRSGRVNVEVDAMPGGYVCSASMKGTGDSVAIRRVARGEDSVGSLFSKTQKAFFKIYAPADLRLRDLVPLGPINILKLKSSPKTLGRKMVAELWLYPNGGRILELSTKCAPDEAFQVAAEARAFLISRGIDLDGEQQTKTKTALEFFSGALKSEQSTEAGPTS